MSSKIDGPVPGAPRVASSTPPRIDRAGGERDKPVAAPEAADQVRLTSEAASLRAIEQHLSTGPAMDLAKVAAVKLSLDSGSYRIDPQEIASRLAALERELSR